MCNYHLIEAKWGALVWQGRINRALHAVNDGHLPPGETSGRSHNSGHKKHTTKSVLKALTFTALVLIFLPILVSAVLAVWVLAAIDSWTEEDEPR